ncbi:hypothetical protein C479_08158 [Halovivax asiaticus JCM 14624]|uniref:DUF2249 domain-containing protein n=2 Tax=Halovivax asiaticus TaxID=332953 RepID=M0BMB2_9EURY|nr:hypothetical protein C479_08158 [Halovivax asiaticus JCM 14624]
MATLDAFEANMIGGRATPPDTGRTAMATVQADRTLDAREIDGEPFADITAELDALDPDETFLLINHFEPKPLYAVLSKRGFDHETTQVADDEWHVAITHA